MKAEFLGLDIPTCAELVQRIEKEAEETLRRASSLIIDEGDKGGKVSAEGIVGKNMNNPEAELWGIGKSKL